ncbi:caspase-3-like isoform X2 [Conger conger]|uniref:caspase-3-like isoform X2 n=1 Tax=Conger conger TaxID=82655 RepID=UPI002A59A699|nr:caspase-3-like isoform X2 [Conger conger]
MSATEKGNETAQGDCVDTQLDSGLMAEGPSPSSQVAPSQVTGDSDPDKYRYNMTDKYTSIGRCVIINNENFHEARALVKGRAAGCAGFCLHLKISNRFRPKKPGEKTRHGTDVDADRVEKTFRGLGYDVKIFKDLKVAKIVKELTKVSKEDHSKMASFVCVILSHGEENGIIYGTDREVELSELTSLFRGDHCATLVGKPKLFFIQACRSEEDDGGMVGMSLGDTEAIEAEESTPRIPVEADFLYGYSTAPGYVAMRDKQDDTWFIKSLCSILDEFGKQLELMQLMTRVNNMVALSFQSTTKQMPCIVSMLTKELYFPK